MKRFLDIFKTDLVLVFIDGIDEIDFDVTCKSSVLVTMFLVFVF